VYRDLFLTAEYVPGLEAREAVHGEAAEPGDDAWARCRGIKSGFQVWQRIEGTELTRLVDVRWLFPSEVDARSYHESRTLANAEGFRPVTDFSMPGTDVAAFAGQDPFGLAGEMRIYLFAFGGVSAKVFTAGVGQDAAMALLQRAVGRIGRALRPEG
jgi:hypothetical protein